MPSVSQVNATNERLLKPAEAAELLGMSPATLAGWRSRRSQPLPFVKVGRSVKYRTADLEAFIEANKDPGGGRL